MCVAAMLAAIEFVPRGFAKQVPDKYEPNEDDVKKWMDHAGFVILLS